MTSAKAGLPGCGVEVPGWVGSPRAHPAQVGLTSLSHAPLQRCKPDSPPFFRFFFSPAPLDQLISFFRPLTLP